MTSKKETQNTKNLPFHERFEIPIEINRVKERFVNRINNQIFDKFFNNRLYAIQIYAILQDVANGLGEPYNDRKDFTHYTNGTFLITIQVVELAYNALDAGPIKNKLSSLISKIVSQSEIDLGIAWKDGYFVKTGAKLLDDKLINEPLRWLRKQGYDTVFEPYEKGLKHYLEYIQDPSRLNDVITDVYEALESLARIVTKSKRDLSANAQLFISKVSGNKYYKEILKNYIAYACEYRHAVELGETRENPKPFEVENFIYLTGIFIRLAIEKIK